jgi:hypothetical protein
MSWNKIDQTAAALQSFRQREASWDQVENFTAMDLSEKSAEYLPMVYPPRSEVLKNYVRDRLAGLISRDQIMAIKNGEWIYTVIKFKTRNRADYDLLMWAGRACKKLNAEQSCTRLRGAVMRYVHNYQFFGKPDYDQALEVQAMDSEERRRNLEK